MSMFSLKWTYHLLSPTGEAQPRKRKAVYELHRTYEDEDIPDDVDRIVERAKRRRVCFSCPLGSVNLCVFRLSSALLMPKSFLKEDRSEGEEPMGESFRYAPRKSRNAIGEPIPVGKGSSLSSHDLEWPCVVVL